MFSLKFYIELYQFFWPNQPKKHPIEIIQNAENLTFGSGTANTAPAHPHRRGPLYLSDFFTRGSINCRDRRAQKFLAFFIL